MKPRRQIHPWNSRPERASARPPVGWLPRVFVFSLLLLPVAAGVAAGDDEGWNLVWQDEFDGPSLDSDRWSFEVNARGGGNKELQYYVTNNLAVRDGQLHIEARNEVFFGPDGTRSYTSSRIRTKGKGDWKYGRFEIRARLPKGKGIWPAIWMLPTENRYGGWPDSGEIDIVELVGHEAGKVHGTLHYGDNTRNHAYRGSIYTLPKGDFSQDFHVFRLDWEPERIRWYVDGRVYQTQTRWHTDGHAFPAPFDQKFHLLINVAVGGNWPGSPDKTTEFPQTLTVDYVRVYQRERP